MPEKFYITTPIYYVNDRPHIGHAYTTIIADVLARFWRRELGDKNVYFLTGTDEHGAKIAEIAAKKQVDPKEYVDQIAQEFKDAWQKLEINYDHFIRTTDKDHVKTVIGILETLKNAKTPAGSDVIYEANYEGLYCVGCEKFINESELINGECPFHPGQKPQRLAEKNWFFRLKDYLPTIKAKIESDELLIYPRSRKNEVLGLIDKQDLPDFSISRSKAAVSWGIDLPWDSEQKTYVWVDALSNYITALGYPDAKDFKKFWPADAQLMALEILKFHALYWPAILLALDLPLPKALYIHGFFTIDGQKMSKSIGNTISPNDLVDKYGAEVTKYLILSQFSFGAESDIRVEDFPVKYNADLVNGLGNLVSRVTNMIDSYLGGQIDVSKLKDHYLGAEELKQFHFREALLTIWKIIQEANATIDKTKPWDLAKSDQAEDKAKLAEILQGLAQDIYSVALGLSPFMPNTSEKILKIIKAKKITKPSEPLFARLK